MLLKGFEIFEHHPADLAAEWLLTWQPGRMILFFVLGESGQVLVALAALLALVRLLAGAKRETNSDVRLNQ